MAGSPLEQLRKGSLNVAVHEGHWDCTICSTRGILGRHKICPSCGLPRPQNVKFYLPDEDTTVNDEALLEQARKGPDWICDYCEASNAADSSRCHQCAAERDSQRQQVVKEYDTSAVPTSGDVGEDPASVREPPVVAVAVPAAATPATSGSGCYRLFLPVLGAVFAVILLIVYLSWPRQREMTVQEQRWQRSVIVEQLQAVQEEGWSIPNGGRRLSQRQAVHHHNRVLDRHETRTREVKEQVQVGTEEYVSGKRDLGNGFFEDIISTRPVYETRTRTETYREPVYREEPVYQTKYKYEIDRWRPLRTERLQATDTDPVWPVLNLEERQRAGPRNEKYSLVLTDAEDNRHEFNTTLDHWRRFPKGARCEVKMVMGNVREVKRME